MKTHKQALLDQEQGLMRGVLIAMSDQVLSQAHVIEPLPKVNSYFWKVCMEEYGPCLAELRASLRPSYTGLCRIFFFFITLKPRVE